jgi:hypothetical protein
MLPLDERDLNWCFSYLNQNSVSTAPQKAKLEGHLFSASNKNAQMFAHKPQDKRILRVFLFLLAVSGGASRFIS